MRTIVELLRMVRHEYVCQEYCSQTPKGICYPAYMLRDAEMLTSFEHKVIELFIDHYLVQKTNTFYDHVGDITENKDFCWHPEDTISRLKWLNQQIKKHS